MTTNNNHEHQQEDICWLPGFVEHHEKVGTPY